MHPIYTFLDEHSLNSFEAVDKIIFEKSDINWIFDTLEGCYNIINTLNTPDIIPGLFNFTVSPSFSEGYCEMLECRVKNAQKLINFGVYYADSIIIKNPFDFYFRLKNHRNVDRPQTEYLVRNKLAGAVDSLISLKEAVNENVVIINPTEHIVCSNAHEDLNRQRGNFSDYFINYFKSRLLPQLEKEICMEMIAPKEISVKGLKNFLQEDGLRHQFVQLPEILKPYDNNYPNIVPNNLFGQTEICAGIIDNSIENLLCQKFDPFFAGGFTYLTDNPLETKLLSSLDSNESENSVENKITMFAQLLPIIVGANLKDAIKLRKNERAAFKAYQYSLRKLFNQTSKLNGQQEIETAINDIVLPEISKLEKIFQKNINFFNASSVLDLSMAAIDFTVGVSAHNLTKIVESIIRGGTTLKDNYLSRSQLDSKLAESDYYFLWRTVRKYGSSNATVPYSRFMPVTRIGVLPD